MILSANPLTNPEFWNVLVLAGGVKSPGLFRLLDGTGRAYKWDIRDAPGIMGAIETFRGWKVTNPIKSRFEFWEARQIDEFYTSFDPLLSYDPRKFRPKPIEAFHPALAVNAINKLIVLEKSLLKDLGKQLWCVEVDFAEYRKPPTLNVTSTPDSPQTRNPVAKTPLQVENLRLLNKFKEP